MDKQGETALARALLSGETDAFERFVDHFRSKIFHYSWLMCGNPEDAEEVAQETLFKVFENFDQLREPERVRSWIFRIARNACLMQRRKSVFAPAHELSIEELPPSDEVAGLGLAPDSELLHTELRDVIDRVVAELPPLYRAVVLLRDLEELTTEETAHILDLGTDVVKTRLHRGRAAMRQKLDCYLHNHCLEDQPSPNPAPLTAQERENLFSVWQRIAATQRVRATVMHPVT
ncbi:MAG TPA: sigma-70 family RNA polymerase sigma factor [Candidatus Solibacter sp.]|nr:sigma-70 family RNA polymerase sigma factor [Candidatus Solibacter sp.]